MRMIKKNNRKMRNKKSKSNRINSKMNNLGFESWKVFIAFGLILSVFVLLLTATLALTNDERTQLEQELSLLEQDLSGAGYSWLVNYSASDVLNSGRIGVYEVNGTREIAEFTGEKNE